MFPNKCNNFPRCVYAYVVCFPVSFSEIKIIVMLAHTDGIKLEESTIPEKNE